MNWCRLDSSVLRSAKYAPDERILYLFFRNGELYSYLDFPPQEYHDFLAANSKADISTRKFAGAFAISTFLDAAHLNPIEFHF